MGKVMEWLKGISHLNKDGSELPDPRPVDVPIGFERPESIQETIRRLVTDPRLREELEANGAESFDDADDFDIPDDDFPQSPHEDQFDPLHLLSREQEVMAGAVRPRTAEEVAAARAAIEAVRLEAEAKAAAKAKSQEQAKA